MMPPIPTTITAGPALPGSGSPTGNARPAATSAFQQALAAAHPSTSQPVAPNSGQRPNGTPHAQPAPSKPGNALPNSSGRRTAAHGTAAGPIQASDATTPGTQAVQSPQPVTAPAPNEDARTTSAATADLREDEKATAASPIQDSVIWAAAHLNPATAAPAAAQLPATTPGLAASPGPASNLTPLASPLAPPAATAPSDPMTSFLRIQSVAVTTDAPQPSAATSATQSTTVTPTTAPAPALALSAPAATEPAPDPAAPAATEPAPDRAAFSNAISLTPASPTLTSAPTTAPATDIATPSPTPAQSGLLSPVSPSATGPGRATPREQDSTPDTANSASPLTPLQVPTLTTPVAAHATAPTTADTASRVAASVTPAITDAAQRPQAPMTRVVVRLDPEHLGPVEITVTNRGTSVSVTASTNSTQAIQALTDAHATIARALNERGLTLDNWTVDDNHRAATGKTGDNSGQGSDRNRPGHTPTDQTGARPGNGQRRQQPNPNDPRSLWL